MTGHLKPDPNTYWVIPGRLLAGEYPGALDESGTALRLAAFRESGVSFFLDLTEPHELPDYRHLVEGFTNATGRICRYQRLPIPDFSVPSPARMREVLEVIAAALVEGHVVYVHCWGGIGRTGTVIGCHLATTGLSGNQALATVQRLYSDMEKSTRRPRSPETAEQADFVRTWAANSGCP